MSLTLDEVRQIRFRMTRRGDVGYQVGDVDTFIDKVEVTFDEFEKERERLRAELDSVQATNVQPAVTDDAELSAELKEKDATIAQLRAELERAGGNADAPNPAEDRVRELTAENEQLRNQLDQVRTEFDQLRSERVTETSGTEHLVVSASEDAAPAVTRLLQMATDQATTLVNEAETEAKRKLSEAEQRAAEIKTDAHTKADRVESEARVNAEQMTTQAEARAADVDRQTEERRNQLFADLEREQAELSTKVGSLRDFEAKYRENITSSLQGLLDNVRGSKPEPEDVPELAQRPSETPRLDALANGEQS